MSRLAPLLALLLLALCCAPPTADRAKWLSMPSSERVLYVKTMIGAEKVKQAKGGNDRTFSRTPQEYAKEIDAAYARGDQRSVSDIFESLADKR